MALELDGPSMALATQDENGNIADLMEAPMMIQIAIENDKYGWAPISESVWLIFVEAS